MIGKLYVCLFVFVALLCFCGCFGPASKQISKAVAEVRSEQDVQQETLTKIEDGIVQVQQLTASLMTTVTAAFTTNSNQTVQVTPPSMLREIVPLIILVVLYLAYERWLKSKKKGGDASYG